MTKWGILIESHLSTIIWHPPIDNRALLGAVESSIIWQGVCAYPCVCNRWRETLVPAVGSCRTHQRAPSSPGCNLEGTGNGCLRQPPADDRAFVEVQVPSTEITACESWEQEREYEFKCDYDFKYKEATPNQGTWKFKETQNCQGITEP